LSLAPVPSSDSTCPNCSATLVADQRYCLSCGQPSSPVRLAFLDVLQSEPQGQVAPAYAAPAFAYAQAQPSTAGPDWLRRYAPLFAVAAVLLLAMGIGLLVGHWVSQGKSSGPQVVKIEGLAGVAAAPTGAAAATSTTATKSTSAASAETQSAKSEAAESKPVPAKVEKKQAATVEKAAPVKQSAAQAQKLSKSTGQKHAEEVNELGDQPIETGG
jgi:hypothetical protein